MKIPKTFQHNNAELRSLIEALLFVSGEPLSFKKLAKIFRVKEIEIKRAIKELIEDYRNSKRGLSIVQRENEVQLTTITEAAPYVTKFLKENFNEDLTRASLETIAIIAYRGPLTRAEIEEIRGVNSSFILRNLTIRGLIDREPHPERPSTYLYKISFELLRHLGIERIEDLPNYNQYREIQINADIDAD